MTEIDTIPAWPMQRRSMLFGAMAALAGTAANAQTGSYPSGPVRLITPSPAGSLLDVMARLYGQEMGNMLRQPFVVDGKPGAGGIIAAETVAKSAADGQMLLVAPDSMFSINPFIYSRLPYDPRKDFRPVSLLGRASIVMVASPALGARNLQEMVDIIKARPNHYSYGSPGIGHSMHVITELFLNRAGLKMLHVPYRGTTFAVQGALSGDVALALVGLAEALPHIKSGRLVGIATSGAAGKELLPDLPQLKVIHPDLDLSVWFALFAPARTPDAAIAAANAAVARAAEVDAVRHKLGEFGLTPTSSTPQAVEAEIASDQAKFGPMVKQLGIKVS